MGGIGDVAEREKGWRDTRLQPAVPGHGSTGCSAGPQRRPEQPTRQQGSCQGVVGYAGATLRHVRSLLKEPMTGQRQSGGATCINTSRNTANSARITPNLTCDGHG